MNPAKTAQLKFLAWATDHGYRYKVCGDYAYSSRPMGMGKYVKMKSAKNGKIQIIANNVAKEI